MSPHKVSLFFYSITICVVFVIQLDFFDLWFFTDNVIRWHTSGSCTPVSDTRIFSLITGYPTPVTTHPSPYLLRNYSTVTRHRASPTTNVLTRVHFFQSFHIRYFTFTYGVIFSTVVFVVLQSIRFNNASTLLLSSTLRRQDHRFYSPIGYLLPIVITNTTGVVGTLVKSPRCRLGL